MSYFDENPDEHSSWDDSQATSNFIERMHERARGFLDGDSDETSAIEHDRFDKSTWAETRQDALDIDNQVKEYAKEYDYVDDFFADLFYLLHKGDPRVRERGEMREDHVPNRELINGFADMQEVKDLRDYTRGDPFGTAMGIGSMDSEIAEAFEKMRAAQELAKQLQELREQIQEAAEKALASMDPDELAELIAEAAGLDQQAGGVSVELDAATSEALGQAAATMRAGVNKAAEDLAQEAQLAGGFGIDPGQLQRMDFHERRKLALQLRNSRMADFAHLFGAFRMLALAAKRKRVQDMPSEIAGLDTSDDLARLVPFEYLNLASAELESDFWLRYANHQLATWKLHGTEKQGRGPIVVVCDESGSMSSPDLGGNSREAWSKAFTLALADLARREKRKLYYIGFSSQGQQWEIDVTEGGFPAVMEVVEHFFGGGTHYDRPLRRALDICSERYAADGDDRPDICFITDDEYYGIEDRFVERWNIERERLSIGTYGLAIGTTGVGGTMEKLCDNVIQVNQLASGVSLAADLFQAM